MRALKYLTPFILYLGAITSFTSYGWICLAPLIYTWILIPILEFIIKPGTLNLTEAEEEVAKHDRIYDYILYMIVLLELPVLFLFLDSMCDKTLGWTEIIGRVGSMGLICGTFGINVGHELGHRVNKFEQQLAKLSLMSSLYMHFFVEHNEGHHKNVGTHMDPNTARYGEPLYSFWLRSIVFGYTDAWRIANRKERKAGRRVWNFKNPMVQLHLIEIGFLLVLGLIFGIQITALFIFTSLLGILLLETVNYIQHYGLTRNQISENKYERAMPSHSWNSDHVIGRLMLFELSRHGDHHYQASRKFQVLRHHDIAPQMPAGFPAMMMLSWFPPAWFYVMNKRIKEYTKKTAESIPYLLQSSAIEKIQ